MSSYLSHSNSINRGRRESQRREPSTRSSLFQPGSSRVSPDNSDDDDDDYYGSSKIDQEYEDLLRLLKIPLAHHSSITATSSTRRTSRTKTGKTIISPEKETRLVLQEPQRRKPRAVSPDYAALAEQKDRVFVSASMGGDCFHASRYCGGLRGATSGIISMLRTGAEMRGKRACRLCRPEEARDPQLLLGHQGRSIVASSRSQGQLVTTPSKQVYVAASLKGKCFHSHPTCGGLRKARGVTAISTDNASAMLMRPCMVCSPSL